MTTVSGEDEVDPFVIGDSLSLYEAAMVYSGRNPAARFISGGSAEDYETFLGLRPALDEDWLLESDEGDDECTSQLRRKTKRRRLSRDVLNELLREIKVGNISPLRWAELANSEPDIRRIVISTIDLVNLARRRQETPEYLTDWNREHLKSVVLHETGLQGRPTKSWHLIEPELDRRAETGEGFPSHKDEAAVVQKWMQQTHPQAPCPKLRTLANKIGTKRLAANTK